ncbi:MAG: single-stranded DNA-binding protein [Candidatus Melainabacteria bacterium]|nr:single-stranded DNA-binding protein [Candidatus Melainabacteria bacterium]
MSLSSITISGKLKSNPDKRLTPNNIPVTNLLIEVGFVGRGQKPGEVQLLSQVVKVNAWRDLAEDVEKNFSVGDKVVVTGRAQINAYTTTDGKRKRELEIDANSVVHVDKVLNIEFPESLADEEQSKPSNKGTQDSFEQVPDIEALNTQEEIPF